MKKCPRFVVSPKYREIANQGQFENKFCLNFFIKSLLFTEEFAVRFRRLSLVFF